MFRYINLMLGVKQGIIITSVLRLGQGTEPKAFLTWANALHTAKSETVSIVTTRKKKDFKEREKRKISQI